MCLSILFGIAAIVVGIFAYQIGLDNNPIMGNKRKILTAIGLILLFLPVMILGIAQFERNHKVIRGINNFVDKLLHTSLFTWSAGVTGALQKSKLNLFMLRHHWLWAVLAVFLSIFTSLWYLTAGTLT